MKSEHFGIIPNGGDFKRIRFRMPVLAKAMEMGMRSINNRKRMRKRVRQKERVWDPYPIADQLEQDRLNK